MVDDKTLFELIREYFKVYLPNIKKRSKHTIRSYRTAVNDFIEYTRAENGIKLAQVTFEMIDFSAII